MDRFRTARCRRLGLFSTSEDLSRVTLHFIWPEVVVEQALASVKAHRKNQAVRSRFD